MTLRTHRTRRLSLWLALLGSLACLAPVLAEAWAPWEAPDGRAFIIPEGWSGGADAEPMPAGCHLVGLKRYLTSEEALVLYGPFPEYDDARAFGDAVLADAAQANEDFQATPWEEGAVGDGELLSCAVTYTEDEAPYRGQCCVVASAGLKALVCVTAPAGSYSPERVQALLVTLIRSGLADLIGGGPAAIADLQWATLPASPLEEAGRGFLFVLEFGLTAPFTAEQETLILARLLEGWKRSSAEEFAPFAEYPTLARNLLHADEETVAEVRAEVETQTRAWLEESDPDDPAVRAVREQLERKGRAVVAGEPPLTEMAQAAYAEMYAFSQALAENPDASIALIDPKETDSLRQRLEASWESFSQQEREAVAQCPALWLVSRAALTYGSDAERQMARERIARVAARASETGDDGNGGGAGGETAVDRMIRSTTMLQIQQQTFDHYMWCHGFRQTPFGW